MERHPCAQLTGNSRAQPSRQRLRVPGKVLAKNGFGVLTQIDVGGIAFDCR
jgi:hypothetical protein